MATSGPQGNPHQPRPAEVSMKGGSDLSAVIYSKAHTHTTHTHTNTHTQLLWALVILILLRVRLYVDIITHVWNAVLV